MEVVGVANRPRIDADPASRTRSRGPARRGPRRGLVRWLALLVLLAYYALPFRARTALIAVASYVFYGWANPIWAVIMFFGSSVDYVCGILLLRMSKLPDVGGLPPVIGPEVERTRGMKLVLATSIVTNLGLLAAFKYTGFVAENVNAMAALLENWNDLQEIAKQREASANELLSLSAAKVDESEL